MAPQVVSPEKRYWMSLLLDAYGELLTEKQRTFMRRYYEQDLSFGEIAQEFDVSRQAIFDAVKHGGNRLGRYESALGLVEKRTQRGSESPESRSNSEAIEDLEVARDMARRSAGRIEKLAGAGGDEKGGLADSIRRELESVAADLRSILDETAPSAATPARAIASAPRPAPAALTRPSFFRDDGPEVD